MPAERHLGRHRQKDEEAGGEGHGVLNTRKRLWKAPDGRVVQVRPSASGAGQPASQDRAPGDSTEPPGAFMEHPISPPSSDELSDLAAHRDSAEDRFDSPHLPLGEGGWSLPGFPPVNPYPAIDPDVNFLMDPVLLSASAPMPTTQVGLPYDEVFQPDTASSFNMPYTTAANYNWLFDLNSLLGIEPQPQGTNPHLGLDLHLPGFMGTLDAQGPERPPPTTAPDSNYRPYNHPQSSSGLAASVGASSHAAPLQISEHHQENPLSLRSSLPAPAPAPAPPPPAASTTDVDILERPMSTISEQARCPSVGEDVRIRVLEVIDTAQPVLPSGRLEPWDYSLLSLPALQEYMELFFSKFNTSYPLIHAATFDPSEAESLLVLSMLLLGATYASREAHQLAVCIHDVIRPQIFAHAGFGARPELWVLQTILLVECFGKSRAGQKQHDMSHLFHGLLINLIRRSDCQCVQTGAGEGESQPERGAARAQWHRWARSEEKKRLALLCFMWDTQHAVLFCQSLCMSAFELRVTMPCSQALWEAEDESEWRDLRHGDSWAEIPFLGALKSLLGTGDTPRPLRCNALSRVLLLHGLMSVAWDMQRRDQTALGAVSFVEGGDWRRRVGAAYDRWMAEFDAYCTETTDRLRRHQQASGDDHVSWGARRREFATFVRAYTAVYHAAQIHLNSSFLDVQIYAGARQILGRPVHRGDYMRSERVVRRWAAEPGGVDTAGGEGQPTAAAYCPGAAARAAAHAAHMLRGASANLEEDTGLFHVPWCLYLSTLTLWAFHHARPGRLACAEGEDSEMVWDAKKEMDQLLAGVLGPSGAAPTRQTGGLVWVMAETLSKVRWGIIHSGVLVLRALIPMRLIGQYDLS